MKGKNLWRIGLVFVIAVAVLGLLSFSQVSRAANSAPNLEITKSVIGDNQVESGEPFVYQLAYRCVSITDHCLNATIIDPLPADLIFLSHIPSNDVVDVNYDAGSHTITFDFGAQLDAGSTGILQINVMFPPGTLPGTTVTNTAVFMADGAVDTASNSVFATVTGQFEMIPEKRLLSPEVVVGFPAQFELRLCSPDSTGGVNALNPVFVDQLPADATFVTAEGVEGVDWNYDSGSHTVTFDNLPTVVVGDECLSRTITLVFDSLPDPILQENTLTVSATPEGCDGSITPLPDHCNGSMDPVVLDPVIAQFIVIPPFPEASGGKESFTASSFIGEEGETEPYTGSPQQTDGLPGETVTYTVSAQNTGYVTLTNVIVTDSIPAGITVTQFTIAPASDPTVDGFYQSDQTGGWIPLPGNPYTMETTIDVASLGLAAGDFLTALRWDIGTLPPQSAWWGANVVATLDPSLDPNAALVILNCSGLSADSSDGPQNDNVCNGVNVINERSVPRVRKTNDTGPHVPGEVVTYTIEIRNDSVAHIPYEDPIVFDILPAELLLLTGTINYISGPVGAPAPLQTITNDYDGVTNQTLIEWRWEGASSYSLAPGEVIIMEYAAQIRDFTPPGRYPNTAVVMSNNPTNTNVYYCDGQPTEYTDTLDLDEDADSSEMVCQNPPSSGYVDVNIFISMSSEKFVRGARDTEFQKLGLTYPGGDIDWKVVLSNTSNVSVTNIVIYDIFPYIGDTGVIDSQSRLSDWRANMMGPVEVPVGLPLTVSYSQSENPCRPEVTNAAGCEDDWTTDFPADPTSVQAIKLDFCDPSECLFLEVGDSLEFTWPMVAPNDAPFDASCELPYDPDNHQAFGILNPACPIAWNSFGFTADGAGLSLLPAEPIRVGIRLTDDEPDLSLGNLVWLDVAGLEQDHLQQPIEQDVWGVSGVRVELWDGTNTTPIDLDLDGEVDFRYTGPDYLGRPGYYLFGGLPAGDYVVRFYPPAGYTISTANQGDQALDSDGETFGTDPTYGDYYATETINLVSDDFTWDQGLWLMADYGDLPFDGINYTYPVTSTGAISPELAARHVIVSDLYLGNTVDGEMDGQPSLDADGDDLNGAPDDEDGIVFTTPIIPGNQACLNVTAITTQTQAANLSAWFDFDGDGTLNGTGEQVFADVTPDSGTDLGGGVYEHCFNVPSASNHGGTLYSRFRLSTDEGLTPEGTAMDGEVEDYVLRMACVGNYVFDDNDYDNVQSAGDTPISGIIVNLTWGGPDGVVGTGDDVVYQTTTDANGEYHFCGLLPDVGDNGDDEYQVSVPAEPGDRVTPDAGDDWLDSDGDSNGDAPVFTIPLPVSTNDAADNDNSYEGYPDDQDDLSFDFGFIVEYDWADWPDSDDGGGTDSYATNNNDAGEGVGPSHRIIRDLYLGSCVDGENDGQPSAASAADQDDLNAGVVLSYAGTCTAADDEDGIALVTPVIAGETACVEVTAMTAAAQAANLSAWFDFNGDGVLSSAENLLSDVRPDSGTDLGGGVYEHCFTVPTDTSHGGTLYSRFRLTRDNDVTPYGPARDGEVEDYVHDLACVGNYVFDDNDYDGTQSAGDTPLTGVTVELTWGGPDGVVGTSDDVTYTTTTDSNGEYHFCGLPADADNDGTNDEYQLSIPNLPSDATTPNQGDDSLDSDGDANGDGPVFTIPIPNPAADNAGNDTGYDGYPDDHDDLSFDFGFIVEFDWADLPDGNDGGGTHSYATDSNNNGEGIGPVHRIVQDMYLGSCVDGENNGQPSTAESADQDDTNAGIELIIGGNCADDDDEDGIAFVTPLVAGNQACVEVTALTATAQNAALSGWIDFNGNGSLTDTGEQVLTGIAPNSGTDLGGGVYEHCFTVPADTSHGGTLYARFRLAATQVSTPFGAVNSGEVEDYALQLACVGNYVFDDNDENDTQSAGDMGISGIDVELAWGGPDGIIGTSDDVTYSTTTDANGEYHFCGLPADAGNDGTNDEYQLSVIDPPGTPVTPGVGDEAHDSDGDIGGTMTNVFTIPLPISTNDNASNDNSYDGYPDDQDDLSFDFGFVVDYDWGDLPDGNDGGGTASYPTDNSDNGEGIGASHIIETDLYLGNCVDDENNGQPDAGAAGDDNNGVSADATGTCTTEGDDEDGIFFVTPLIADQAACVQVSAQTSAAQAANLSGWIDFNGNGALDDTGEQVLSDVAPSSGTDLGGGIYEHCFTVPSDTAHGGTLFSRFRLSTDDGLSHTGAASDGEVEDYVLQLACVGNYVWDDQGTTAGAQDAGDVPVPGVVMNLIWGGADGVIGTSDDVTYATTTDSNGEYHFCGLLPDPTNDGADEYQVVIPTLPGSPIAADQAGGDDALDSDGDASGNGPVFTIPLPVTTNDNAPNDDSYDGYADDEDDLSFDFGFIDVSDPTRDWGDLPDGEDGGGADSYPTTNADNGEGSGPRHTIVPNLYLGNCVDAEYDGQPSAAGSAENDDTATGTIPTGAGTCTADDDEDGITFATPLIPGETACINVSAQTSAAQAANLFGWIDFGGDGSFATAGDQILAGVAPSSGTDLGSGIYQHCFSVPDPANHGGTLYARFRLSTDSGLSYTGAASDGEVEDYALQTACVGNYIWDDSAGSGADTQDGSDAGLGGVTVELVWGGPDGVIGTSDDVTYTTTSAAGTGQYHFCGLPEESGEYQVVIPTPPSGLVVVQPDQGGDDSLDSDGTPSATNAAEGPVFNIGELPFTSDNDTAPNDTPVDGYSDDQDDLSFDFGFTEPLGLGNIVFGDTGAGGNENNGVLDGDESGIDNVTMQLYYDDGDMVFNSADDTFLTSQDTASGGMYLFTNLSPGCYFVHIPASEFISGGDLYDAGTSMAWQSSSGGGSDDMNDHNADENGVDDALAGSNGITSNKVCLSLGSEPTSAGDGELQDNHPVGYDDEDVNLTVDFGFYLPQQTAVLVSSVATVAQVNGVLFLTLLVVLVAMSWIALQPKRNEA